MSHTREGFFSHRVRDKAPIHKRGTIKFMDIISLGIKI